MARKLPSLNALHAFEAAARLGSLTRAAGELHVTHGAVSRQIKALEGELGKALFAREGRGLALTAAGARLRDAPALLSSSWRNPGRTCVATAPPRRWCWAARAACWPAGSFRVCRASTGNCRS